MFLFLSSFRWRVARYDGVAVSPRLPLAARRRRWDHCHGHGTKKAKEGRLCVCEKTGPPPARVGFRFPPTDNFEKKKKENVFTRGKLVGVEGNPRDSNSTQRDPEKQHRIAPYAAEAPLRCQ